MTQLDLTFLPCGRYCSLIGFPKDHIEVKLNIVVSDIIAACCTICSLIRLGRLEHVELIIVIVRTLPGTCLIVNVYTYI